MLKLCGFRISNYHNKVRLVLLEKAIAFEEDDTCTPKQSEEFLARTPVGYAVLWDKGGATLAERFDVTRLPTTLVLDREGVVRAVHLGYDREVGKTLEAEVRALLGQ